MKTFLVILLERLAKWAARKQYEISKRKVDIARKTGLLILVAMLSSGCARFPLWLDKLYVETYEAMTDAGEVVQ